MDDVSEQFRIFVGFFVVQIYQSSVKKQQYNLGLLQRREFRAAPRQYTPSPPGADRADPPTAPGCGAKSYTPKTAAEPATNRCWPSVQNGAWWQILVKPGQHQLID
jgi:hypothetical protein